MSAAAKAVAGRFVCTAVATAIVDFHGGYAGPASTNADVQGRIGTPWDLKVMKSSPVRTGSHARSHATSVMSAGMMADVTNAAIQSHMLPGMTIRCTCADGALAPNLTRSRKKEARGIWGLHNLKRSHQVSRGPKHPHQVRRMK